MSLPHTSYRVLLSVAIVGEFVLAFASLSLFLGAYVSPDEHREALWLDGGESGWNSDPRQRIYFYANYKEPPPIPLIWGQRSITYTVTSIKLMSSQFGPMQSVRRSCDACCLAGTISCQSDRMGHM
jgi:hypothetical protein